jgi:hypothetical protein
MGYLDALGVMKFVSPGQGEARSPVVPIRLGVVRVPHISTAATWPNRCCQRRSAGRLFRVLAMDARHGKRALSPRLSLAPRYGLQLPATDRNVGHGRARGQILVNMGDASD